MCMFNNFMSGKYCEEVKANDDTEGRGRKKMTSKKVFLNGSKKEWSSKRGTFWESGSLEHIKDSQKGN